MAAGSTVVVATSPEHLAGCDVAFTSAEQAEAALDAGVDEVLACSLTPFATRLQQLPPMVLDAAVELPGHGDHFSGRPTRVDLRVDDQPLIPITQDVSSGDRVLTALPLTQNLGALLGVLQQGAAVILLAHGDQAKAISQESATAVLEASGLTRVT